MTDQQATVARLRESLPPLQERHDAAWAAERAAWGDDPDRTRTKPQKPTEHANAMRDVEIEWDKLWATMRAIEQAEHRVHALSDPAEHERRIGEAVRRAERR